MDIKCPRFRIKKDHITLAVNFFPSQRKISNEPRFSQFSSYLKRSLPISVYKMQNMKCKVYATPVLRSAKKKKSKKENADELFATISKRTNLLTTCTCAVMVFGWNVNLFCYVASWRCVSKLTNKKLKRCPQQWWHLSEPTLTQNKDCCHFWNVCNSPIE